MLLEDYGLIGDLESAALVGRTGAVDWLCFPRSWALAGRRCKSSK